MKKLIKEIEDMGSDNVTVFGGKFEGGINLQQIPDEIAPAVSELKKHNIKSYLEIGSAAGGLAALLNHFLDLGEIVIIDDNLHIKAELRADSLKGMGVTEIVGNSHDKDIIQAVKGFKFDLITFDGDHTYNGISQDFKDYTPMLNNKGVVLFHDTVHWSTPGVNRFVSGLKKKKSFKLLGEYISEMHVSPCGVALFQKN